MGTIIDRRWYYIGGVAVPGQLSVGLLGETEALGVLDPRLTGSKVTEFPRTKA